MGLELATSERPPRFSDEGSELGPREEGKQRTSEGPGLVQCEETGRGEPLPQAPFLHLQKVPPCSDVAPPCSGPGPGSQLIGTGKPRVFRPWLPFCCPPSGWDTPRSVLFLLPQTEDLRYLCPLTAKGNTKDGEQTHINVKLAEAKKGLHCPSDQKWRAAVDVRHGQIWAPTTSAGIRLLLSWLCCGLCWLHSEKGAASLVPTAAGGPGCPWLS